MSRTLLLLLALLAALGAEPRTDRYGDPLPPGAVARLGTARLRHRFAATSLALSPDGKRLASSGSDGTVRLWETATGKMVRLFAEVYGEINPLAYAADGKTLAGGVWLPRTNEWQVRVWDVATGREVRRLPWVVEALAFSSDHKTLAVAGRPSIVEDKPAVLLWDVAAGRELRRLPGSQIADSVAFSPDGKILATGHSVLAPERLIAFGEVRLWEVATGRQRSRLRGLLPQVRAVAFSADGKQVTADSAISGRVHTWEADSGKLLRAVSEDDFGIALCFAALPGRTLAVRKGRGFGSEFEKTVVEEADTGRRVRTLRGPGTYFDVAAVSADGRIVARADDCGAIDLWDVSTGKLLPPCAGHLHRLKSIQFSTDGRTLATRGNRVRLWDASDGRALACFDAGDGYMAFSPDLKLLVAGDTVSPLRLWQMSSGKMIRQLSEESAGACQVAFSPNGGMIATGDVRGNTALWDAATGRHLRTREHPKSNAPSRQMVRQLAFTPDGKSLLVLHRSGHLFVWDDDARMPRSLADRPGLWEHYHFALSPDGDTLALISQLGKDGGRQLSLWDFPSGRLRGRVTEWGSGLAAVRFSPDGRTLAVSREQILLYELASGKVRRRVGEDAPFAFAPDGRTLAAADGRTSALLWDVTGLPHGQKELRLSAAELRSLWADLAGADAEKAYRAVWRLSAAPADAVPMLRDALKPVPAPDPALLARLIADLDSDHYDVREKASRELEARLSLAEPALRKALEEKPSLELRRRVERLLHLLEWPVRSPQVLRGLRAVEVLELVGTSEAKKLLRELARGAPQAPLTRAAKVALQRLAHR